MTAVPGPQEAAGVDLCACGHDEYTHDDDDPRVCYAHGCPCERLDMGATYPAARWAPTSPRWSVVTAAQGSAARDEMCPWCRVRPGDFRWLVDGHQANCPALPHTPAENEETDRA